MHADLHDTLVSFRPPPGRSVHPVADALRPALAPAGAVLMRTSPTEADVHAALIRRIADHADRAAFAMLFAHFAPRVKAYMRKLGAMDAQAEDMAQEALFAVWRKASQFDPARAGAATWVFTIARNLRIDTLRRERPAGPLPFSEPPETDGQPGAEAEMMVAERDRALRAALALLPPQQAQLVQLAFYEDRPHREIERVLGIPLGTVKSRLRLALQRLRGALADERGEKPQDGRPAGLEHKP